MVLVGACQEKIPSTNRQLTLDAYAGFADSQLAINSHRIRANIDSLMRNDTSALIPDFRTRDYYNHDGDFVWIDRHGMDWRADTLMSYLKQVGKMGFSTRCFFVEQVGRDLERVRHLDFDEHGNDINRVMARIEYRLTKAYLHYAQGQRFGYVNPTYLLNRLDTLDHDKKDTVARAVRFRGLFDIPMAHADKAFFGLALQKAKGDSLGIFLREIQPVSPFYQSLEARLQEPGLSKAMRAKVMCNMERCRWRLEDYPQQHRKYVVVNIPSYHLMAVDGEDTLTMRIGCGSYATKTPLLTSQMKRMDVNPKWFVPMSIIKKDIVRHAGNKHYFDSRNFYVAERSTGQEIDIYHVTRAMLLDPAYAVVQRGGKGNSLGRIIFRFDNNFSVFLHDTSSRGVFSRDDRSVSHGCVRVEKPFELAVFLLKDKDERIIEKIKYSMTADSLSDKSRVVNSVKVEP